MKSRKHKFYLSPPVDDVALLDEVGRKFARRIGGDLPSRAELIAYADEHGMETATAIWYLCLRARSGLAELADDGAAIPTARQWAVKPRLVLIPSMFYREYPDVGGNGAHFLQIARSAGFEVEMIETLSRGPIDQNVRTITREITSRMKQWSEPVWFFTLSRSGMELRMAIQSAPDLFSGRRWGWINASGLPYGNSLADQELSTPLRRLRWWLIGKKIDFPSAHLRAMGEVAARKLGDFTLPPSIRVINVVPVPLPAHISTSLIGKYKKICKFGPSDGMTTSHASVIEPGEHLPIWGADHYLRTSHVNPIFHRLFHYIAADENRRRSEEKIHG